MTTTATFVPSGTPVTFTPIDTTQTVTMPTVDGANTDVLITSTCGGSVYLTFGATVAAGGQLLRGDIEIRPHGQAVLLTATQATATAAAADPLVIYLPSASTASTVSVIATMRGGSVTLQRGTATPRNTF